MNTAATDHLKDGMKWSWGQLRRYLFIQSVIIALTAAAGVYGTYLYIAYEDISGRLIESLPPFSGVRDDWGVYSNELFLASNSSLTENAKLPSKADLVVLQKKIVALTAAINTLPTPTDDIYHRAFNFKAALNDTVRAIGAYDGTADGMTKIVVRSQQASEQGALHKNAIENYLGGAWSRLWGSL